MSWVTFGARGRGDEGERYCILFCFLFLFCGGCFFLFVCGFWGSFFFDVFLREILAISCSDSCTSFPSTMFFFLHTHSLLSENTQGWIGDFLLINFLVSKSSTMKENKKEERE